MLSTSQVGSNKQYVANVPVWLTHEYLLAFCKTNNSRRSRAMIIHRCCTLRYTGLGTRWLTNFYSTAYTLTADVQTLNAEYNSMLSTSQVGSNKQYVANVPVWLTHEYLLAFCKTNNSRRSQAMIMHRSCTLRYIGLGTRWPTRLLFNVIP